MIPLKTFQAIYTQLGQMVEESCENLKYFQVSFQYNHNGQYATIEECYGLLPLENGFQLQDEGVPLGGNEQEILYNRLSDSQNWPMAVLLFGYKSQEDFLLNATPEIIQGFFVTFQFQEMLNPIQFAGAKGY